MLLALRIVGAVYVIAMAVLGGLWREVFRRSDPTPDYGSPGSNVIPFERGSAESGSSETGDHQAT
jgi:hypothetical protein